MARAPQPGLGLHTWGGKRKGAGRKPAGDRAGVPHQRRPALSPNHPAHVTLRVLPDVWNLRGRRAFRAIGRALASSKERDGFLLVEFSVQRNELHLIVEARDAQRLSRGMQGLATWIARRLNQLIGRRGKVFADRFHAQVLRTPPEVARQAAKLDPQGSAGAPLSNRKNVGKAAHAQPQRLRGRTGH
jgi:REP element-mobilizing transposase RayT